MEGSGIKDSIVGAESAIDLEEWENAGKQIGARPPAEGIPVGRKGDGQEDKADEDGEADDAYADAEAKADASANAAYREYDQRSWGKYKDGRSKYPDYQSQDYYQSG